MDETPAPFGKTRHNDRRCAATREALAPGDPALRFVLSPEGELTLDLKGKLPGRGAWIRPSRSALRRAIAKGGFSRAFKAQPRMPGERDAASFAEMVDAQLQSAALARLGLTRRAGHLIIGRDAVLKAAKKGIAYLTPLDASEAEISKLAQTLAKSAGVPHVPLPTGRDTLAAAIGADGVHLLLVAGGPAKAAEEAVQLWRSFSTEERA